MKYQRERSRCRLQTCQSLNSPPFTTVKDRSRRGCNAGAQNGPSTQNRDAKVSGRSQRNLGTKLHSAVGLEQWVFTGYLLVQLLGCRQSKACNRPPTQQNLIVPFQPTMTALVLETPPNPVKKHEAREWKTDCSSNTTIVFVLVVCCLVFAPHTNPCAYLPYVQQ